MDFENNSSNNNFNNNNNIEVKKIEKNIKYIVLVVDMDDDIGRKANIKTPLLGRDDCIEGAIKLGLADPGDTDTNSILGGIKLYDELKKEGKDVEIIVIAGHKNVESEECALKIKEQLDFLNYLYDPNFIYIVSDGKEDELVLNYLRNNNIFVWKKRIVIKQNESLESTYYLIQEFLHKTMSQYVPLIFTVIGFVLVMGALLEGLGWRIIAGLAGIYILLEGSGLTKSIRKSFKEGKESIEFGKITPIGNILSAIIIIIGILYAYKVSSDLEYITALGTFLYTIANPLTLGILIYIVIHFIDEVLYSEKDLINLFKGLFFKILLIFMSRELLLLFSEFLYGDISFIIISVYVAIYVSIIVLLSAILFHIKKQ